MNRIQQAPPAQHQARAESIPQHRPRVLATKRVQNKAQKAGETVRSRQGQVAVKNACRLFLAQQALQVPVTNDHFRVQQTPQVPVTNRWSQAQQATQLPVTNRLFLAQQTPQVPATNRQSRVQLDLQLRAADTLLQPAHQLLLDGGQPSHIQPSLDVQTHFLVVALPRTLDMLLHR